MNISIFVYSILYTFVIFFIVFDFKYYYFTAKILWELIEPVEQRIKAVLDFLTDINPELEYNVVPIQDLYGPTKHDPRLQVCEYLNRKRIKKS